MSLSAALLLARTADAGAVVAELRAHLAESAARLAAGDAAAARDRALLGPAGERRVRAVAQGEWTCVVEESGAVDGALARRLSRAAGFCLAVELDGQRYALRLRAWTAGEPGTDLASAAELPEDVEQLAWRALAEAGVPAGLRLARFSDLVEVDGDGLAGGELVLDGAGLHARELALAPLDAPDGPLPPARADLWLEDDAGAASVVELRHVAAPRSAEHALRLAALEEAAAARLVPKLAAEADGSLVPSLRFEYDDATAGAAAAEARVSRPRLVRWLTPGVASAVGFAEDVRAALGPLGVTVTRCRPGLVEYSRPGHPGWTFEVALRQPFADYLALDAEPRSPAAVVATAVRARLAAAEPAPETWDAAAARLGLLPTLVAEDAPDRASAPLAGALRAALLARVEGRIAPVSAAALDAWGLAWDEALLYAVANADEATAAAPEGLTYYDLDDGRVIVASFDDPAGAGRLLSPTVRRLLCELAGGPCLAAAPTRDTLLAISAAEPGVLGWLQAEAARRFAEGPHPISPELFALTETEVIALDPAELARFGA